MFKAKISLAGSGRTGIRQNRPLFPGQLSEVIDETVGHDRTCTDDRARWDDRLLARPACAGREREAGGDEAGASAAGGEADRGGVPRAGPGRPGQGARAIARRQRVLRVRFGDADQGGPGETEQRRQRAHGASGAEGPDRGELRRARLGPVQPRPRPAPGGLGEEVSRHARSAFRPDHRHQLRRGEAEGPRPRRGRLEAEPARRPHRKALRTCTIFGCSAGGAATISPPASRCREPSKRVTTPPASSTSSWPAATSQGLRPSSQNPSSRPAATHARSIAALPSLREPRASSVNLPNAATTRGTRPRPPYGKPVQTTASTSSAAAEIRSGRVPFSV